MKKNNSPIKNKKIIAVIIAAHNVDNNFLVLLHNIKQQRLPKNWICHIFIGVDGCNKTKKLLIEKNIEFYYSKKNVGTYVIANSLMKIAKSYNPAIYARFDSDDLPNKNYLYNGIKNCIKIDFVRANYKWKNHPTKNDKIYRPAYGIIFINSDLISLVGGYSEYRIEGDNDLLVRLKNLGYDGIVKNIFQKIKILHKIYYKNLPTFERFYSLNSLSANKATGHKTIYRENIKKILEENRSKSNKVFPKTIDLDLIKY